MKAIELKIPPVALVIAFAVFMWLSSIVAPEFHFSFPLLHLLALVLVAGGAGIAVSGIVSFARAKTTVNPLNPEAATALVESDVYRFSRNPMYLGFLVVLLSWAVFLANVLAALLLIGFVLYMNRFQIILEERVLSAKFGSAFSTYSARVRWWL